MAKVPYLISFFFLFYHCARSVTIPSPSVISQSSVRLTGFNWMEDDIQQHICDLPESSLSNSSTGGVSWDPEKPPEGLIVEFQYVRGGMMAKFEVWNAIVSNIARVAQTSWNAELMGSMSFPPSSNVDIRFVSSVNPPRYHSKSIIWTLAEVFNFYSEERHYSNCFIKTQLVTGPTTLNLGVGSIKSTLTTVEGLRSNSSVLGSSSESLSELKPSMLELDTSTPISFNQSIGPDTNNSLSHSLSQDTTTLQAGTGRLSFVISYRVDGATFNDRNFYEMVINMIIFAAQHDPKNQPCGLIQAFNSRENYTFSIGPTSEAARDNLPWKLVIPALGYLPTEMLGHGPGGRWAELLGRLKLDGAYIGRVQILTGDRRDPESGSCGMAVFGGAGDGGDADGSASEARRDLLVF